MSEKNVDKAELLVEQIWNEKHKPGQAYPRKHQWKKAIKEALDTKDREYEAVIGVLVEAFQTIENLSPDGLKCVYGHNAPGQQVNQVAYETLSHPLVQEYLKKEKI